jgi:hypothetical protein
VQGLEDLYGPRWRQAYIKTVIYGRPKVDEIRRWQAEAINTGAAMEEVALIRRRYRQSMHQLFRLLNL